MKVKYKKPIIALCFFAGIALSAYISSNNSRYEANALRPIESLKSNATRIKSDSIASNNNPAVPARARDRVTDGLADRHDKIVSPTSSNDGVKTQKNEKSGIFVEGQSSSEKDIETIFDPMRYPTQEIQEKFSVSVHSIDEVNRLAKVESIECKESSCLLKIRNKIEDLPEVQSHLLSFYTNHQEYGKWVQADIVEGDPTLFTYTFSNEPPLQD